MYFKKFFAAITLVALLVLGIAGNTAHAAGDKPGVGKERVTNNGGPYLYVPESNGFRTAIFDSDTMSEISSEPMGAGLYSGVAVSPDGTKVYVANDGPSFDDQGDTLTEINRATHEQRVLVLPSHGYVDGCKPSAVTVHPSGLFIYVGCNNASSVEVVDAATLEIVHSITVGWPYDIAVSALGNYLYVTDHKNFAFHIINNGGDYDEVSVLRMEWPWAIAVPPTGDVVYVTHGYAGATTIDEINVADPRHPAVVTPSITVGEIPSDIALNQDGTQLYIPVLDVDPSPDNSPYHPAVQVVDLGARAVVKTIPMSDHPHAINFSSDYKCAFTVNDVSVSAIDINTDQETRHSIPASSGHSFRGHFITSEAPVENMQLVITNQYGNGIDTNEAAGTAQITVTRGCSTVGAATVHYATSDDTATAGQDYVFTSGTLTFADGEYSKTIEVPIINDNVFEGNFPESFMIDLSDATGGVVGTPSSASVNIQEDDQEPPTARLYVSAYAQPDPVVGGGQLTYHINVHNNGPDTATSVTLSDTLSAGLTFASLTTSSGSCTTPTAGQTGTISCSLGNVERGGGGDTRLESSDVQLTLVANVAAAPGATIANTIAVSSPVFDPYLEDNQQLVQTQVVGAVCENVSWIERVNVYASGNTIQKSATNKAWNAGAISGQSISSGDGYVEATVANANDQVLFGLSNDDTSADDSDVDFSIYTRAAAGKMQVTENGVNKGRFNYAQGDVLRVAVASGQVKYYRNGSVFYTSSAVPQYPLLLDSSLYSPSGQIANARICGMLAAQPAAPSAEDVRWTQPLFVTVNGNSIEKTLGSNAWNAQALSAQSLLSGDGYVEATVLDSSDHAIFGLSNGDSGPGQQDIDFGFYTNPDAAKLYVREGGANRVGVSYAYGDVLRVAVRNGQLRYYQNGNLLYYGAVAPTYPLIVDTALRNVGAQVSYARIGGDNLYSPAPNYPPPAEDVVWAQPLNVTVSGNSISKNRGGNAWNAQAQSSKAIAAGDGYVEATVQAASSYAMFGLSNGDSGPAYQDIDFALYTNPGNGKVQVRENGTAKVSVAYVVGDVLRVAVENGQVRYYKNGVLIYNSAIAPTYPLLLDSSLRNEGASIANAHIAGYNLIDLVPPTPPAPVNVVWTQPTNVAISGNAIRKNVKGNAWNAQALSSNALNGGDGYVQATVQDMTSYVMFGLSHGNTNADFHDIDFALYTRPANGRLQVMENGISRASVPYAVGDLLRVAVENGQVRYYQNGTLIYISKQTPSYPLIIDTSLRNNGAVLANAVVGGFGGPAPLKAAATVKQPQPECKQQFSDVPANSAYAAAVRDLACRGAISGYGDGTFKPEASITRAQLVKIVVLAYDWWLVDAPQPSFKDVSVKSPYYDYIETAAAYGAIGGYADGAFKPEASVTRGQLAKIMVLTAGWAPDTSDGPHFKDVPAGSTFYEYVETAYLNGAIGGYGDGTFKPAAPATRGQVAAIVVRAMGGK